MEKSKAPDANPASKVPGRLEFEPKSLQSLEKTPVAKGERSGQYQSEGCL